MGRYAKLGTLAVRWTALCFFLLALVFLPFGFAGGVNGYEFAPFWWGPSLANLLMGGLLFALSRKIGGALGFGLED